MNEELQSTNDELAAINDELNQRGDELNITNAFLESILASIEAGVAVVDGELLVTAWNDGARDLWGLRADEVVGQHLLNLDIGLPVDQLRKPLREIMKDGNASTEITVDALNRRGRPFRCTVVFTPLQDHTVPRGAILFMTAAETV
jgi:two-component system CheB/CheR fusion protein